MIDRVVVRVARADDDNVLAAVHNVISATIVNVDGVVAPSSGDGVGAAGGTVDEVVREVARYLVVSGTACHLCYGVAFPVNGIGAAGVLHLRAFTRVELDGQVLGHVHEFVRSSMQEHPVADAIGYGVLAPSISEVVEVGEFATAQSVVGGATRQAVHVEATEELVCSALAKQRVGAAQAI